MLLSRQARADLEDIRLHTVKTWGRAQWLAYYRQIAAALEQIAETPERGRDRGLFIPGMRSTNCGRHVNFYKRIEAAGATVVLRIVHQRRNLPALAYYDDLDAPG